MDFGGRPRPFWLWFQLAAPCTKIITTRFLWSSPERVQLLPRTKGQSFTYPPKFPCTHFRSPSVSTQPTSPASVSFTTPDSTPTERQQLTAAIPLNNRFSLLEEIDLAERQETFTQGLFNLPPTFKTEPLPLSLQSQFSSHPTTRQIDLKPNHNTSIPTKRDKTQPPPESVHRPPHPHTSIALTTPSSPWSGSSRLLFLSPCIFSSTINKPFLITYSPLTPCYLLPPSLCIQKSYFLPPYSMLPHTLPSLPQTSNFLTDMNHYFHPALPSQHLTKPHHPGPFVLSLVLSLSTWPRSETFCIQ